MQLDLIGYRYTSEELAVLMSLQGQQEIRAMPFIKAPSQDQFRVGRDSLENGDILSIVGGHLLLDKVHSLLIANLCECDSFYRADAQEYHLALCACRQMALLIQSGGKEQWVVQAAPDINGISEEFMEAIERFPRGGVSRLTVNGVDSKENSLNKAELKAEAENVLKQLGEIRSVFA